MASRPMTAEEKDQLVASFLEIAAGNTAETATQHLQATGWKLEEALQLFYVGGETAAASASTAPGDRSSGRANDVVNAGVESSDGDDSVRAPLPVVRDTLYGDLQIARLPPNSTVAFRNFEEELRQPAVWNTDQNAASAVNTSPTNLASMFRPPFALMFRGPFDAAKLEAARNNIWLLINMQSKDEFASHMLNRDTWANETITQTIHSNFIFWQVYHDSGEGQKVCTYYNLVSMPATLVIDPITGQKMHSWTGMIQPERLLEDLLPFLDNSPKEHHAVLKPHKRLRDDRDEHSSARDKTAIDEDEAIALAVAASLKGVKEDAEEPEKDSGTITKGMVNYPPLPEEPKCNKDLICRVGIRLPDGRRLQRNFLLSDPIKLLWSFCSSQLDDDDARKLFHFAQAIPGAQKNLDFDSGQTFEEAGLASSMLTLLWK